MTNKPLLDIKTAKLLPWLVAMSFFMQMLDGTILNTALPAIAGSLGENPLRMQAVLISYMLTTAICIPASGWLTDRVGPRRLMIWSIGLFTFGSLLCALSTSLAFMIVARILQGAGGALMVPVGRLVILRLYPKDDLVRVLSIIPIPGLFGSLIGPALGGLLVQYASWHWIFLINLPVGLLGMLATKKIMPIFELDKKDPFDVLGFIAFAASLVMISLSLEIISHPAMDNYIAGLLAILGLIIQVFYWVRLSPRPISLFKTGIFKTKTFSVGLAANLFARLGSGATPFLLPLLLQVVLGHTPLFAGLLMMPMALASVCAKLLAKPLANHFKYRSILLTNTILQGLLISSLALVPMDMSPFLFCVQLAALGGINSIQFSFLNTYTLMDLPYKYSGSGNALMSVMMQLSQSLAVGMAAAILIFFQGTSTVTPGADMTNALKAFHHTFVMVGATSIISAVLFFFSPKK
ncbi:MFS transporter [Deltaproteobacteria bacterium Smac51]|nr:MFS transporter [Deltaproteobacteria bacterium Smac51]